MGREFEMSMPGELNFCLRLQVKQTSKGMMISQQKYIKELLKRFEMEISKTIDTLISTVTRLDMDEPGSPVNETMYRGIIGYLLYLTASRPDNIFSVGLCARFQSSPKESHLNAAKEILRKFFDLVGYADYVEYLMDRKSTSGMSYFLGSCLISWGTKKQTLQPFQMLKLNIWLLLLVVLNYYKSSKILKTLVYLQLEPGTAQEDKAH
uniref:Uncharacterized mitochondrial protein AtMg00810-like n=1 Tax=Nicotiana tabacum TaxID=4097 RepID=A0A1S4BJ24_TOBAC|nr:PREDICTED: uncharacterized mitochondrial protein AtMg00810-like [Nicotiana tabacum]